MECVRRTRTKPSAVVVFQISGRELFEFNPELIIGDDEEADDIICSKRQDEVKCLSECTTKDRFLFLSKRQSHEVALGPSIGSMI